MELKVSNKREVGVLALLFGVVGFMVMFFMTPFVLQIVYGAPDFEKYYLTETDAYLNNLVDRCSKETVYYLKADCTQLIEDAWHIDCSMDYDKLDTCKNGKIENFLKSHGIPT